MEAESTAVEGPVTVVGERLREARGARGLDLGEVAARTRVPTRHLASIEAGHWAALPGTTYTLGFARAYAQAVGLDPGEVAAELRQEIAEGGPRLKRHEPYEPADPKRVPGRLLTGVAVAAALVFATGYAAWRANLDKAPEASAVASADRPAVPGRPAATAPAAPATGPVILIATQPVWFRVSERGQAAALWQGELAAGQRYEVPATAAAPVLRTTRPEALAVTVGGRTVAPLGEAGASIRNRSLLPRDLLAPPGTSRPAPNG